MPTSEFVDVTPPSKQMVTKTSKLIRWKKQLPKPPATSTCNSPKLTAASTCNSPSRPAKDAAILRMRSPPSLGHHQNSIPPPVVNGPELAAVARAIHPTHSNEESEESEESERYDETAEPSKLPGEGVAHHKSTRISSNDVYDDIIDFDLCDEGAGIQGDTADGNGLFTPVDDIDGNFNDFPPEAEGSKYMFSGY